MPVRTEYDARYGKDVLIYSNMLCRGENHFHKPRVIGEDEFVALTNVDIATPGVRRKRKPQSGFNTLGVQPIRGMGGFTIAGTEYLLFAQNSAVYKVDSALTVTILAGAAINTSTNCLFVPAAGVMYIVDGAGALFRTDGTTVTAVTMVDAGNVALGPIQDLVFFLNRLWFAVSDYVYFSHVIGTTAVATTDLQTIGDLPLAILVGNGGTVRRIITYRGGLLLIFKYGVKGAPGSIHLADVSANIPSAFLLNVLPQFESINLVSPRTVVRAGFDLNAEVVFGTTEGLRTEHFTALDRMVTPSLPFSTYEIDNVQAINPNAYDSSLCAFFNDELFWMIPTGANTSANLALSYQTKIPKENAFQGWSTLDFLAFGSIALTCACISSFEGTATLYVGMSSGAVLRLLSGPAPAGGLASIYSESSRFINFELPDQDKELTDLTVDFAGDHVGTMSGQLTFNDGTTAALPTFGSTGSGAEKTVTIPLNLDSLGGNRKICKEVMVTLTSIAEPSILGYQVRAIAKPFKRQGYDETVPTAGATPAAVTQDAVTAGALTWI